MGSEEKHFLHTIVLILRFASRVWKFGRDCMGDDSLFGLELDCLTLFYAQPTDSPVITIIVIVSTVTVVKFTLLYQGV